LKKYFKYLLQKYIPNVIEYFLFFKSFISTIHLAWIHLWRDLKYSSILNSSKHFSSAGLTYPKVIRDTFLECYEIFKTLNMVYFGEVKKASYRFLIVDNKGLEEKLIEALDLGFVVAIENNGVSKLFFAQKSSRKKLKKYLKKFTLLRVYKIYKNESNIEEFGENIAFEIEKWYEKSGQLETKSNNGIQNSLTWKSIDESIQTTVFNKEVRQIKELYAYFKFLDRDVVKEIDLVYTWVDGEDSQWLEKKNSYDSFAQNLHTSSTLSNRFTSRDELKYSLRSVEKYLSFYRKIFIVVDKQKPVWLKESENLIVVDHADIFPNTEVLPVFNSHAIETVLHKIEGLSEHYLYLNDDVLFGRAVNVSLFFPKKGTISIFPSSETFIPFAQTNQELLPVDTASINTRTLLNRDGIGFAIHKFKHTPLPQIKSLLVELEELFLENIEKTRKKKFRHRDDVSLCSSLLFNFAYFKGLALVKPIQYTYIDVGSEASLFALKKITQISVRERTDVFCVNDTFKEFDKEIVKLDFIDIMEKFLPEKSRYEK